jgi:hypothetical protein
MRFKGREREVKGRGRGKAEWERGLPMAIPTLSSLFLSLALPSVFPEIMAASPGALT